MYMPDTIAAFSIGKKQYFATANEGDAREYSYEDPEDSNKDRDDLLVDVARVKTLEDGMGNSIVDPKFDTSDAALGRLDVSTIDGKNVQGNYTELYAFGTRSFSIFDDDGELVFDSGDDFENKTAELFPDYFNSDNDESSFDTRSDAKGPEPEALAVGEACGKLFAFIGLERIGGIMVRPIHYRNYTNKLSSYRALTLLSHHFLCRSMTFLPQKSLNSSSTLTIATSLWLKIVERRLDSAPESIIFISGADSPTGQPLLAVANEVSGTTTSYSISCLTMFSAARTKSSKSSKGGSQKKCPRGRRGERL